LHRAKEPKTLPGESPNEALLSAIISNGVSDHPNPAAQRGFGDDAPAPHLGDQIVLADSPVTIANQMKKQVEDLRFEFDRIVTAPKFGPVGIEQMDSEPVLLHSNLPQYEKFCTVSRKNQDFLKAKARLRQ
jgi:hypothetical protein